eukprot:1149816-Pelagomonas_calceolata.AAC.6
MLRNQKLMHAGAFYKCLFHRVRWSRGMLRRKEIEGLQPSITEARPCLKKTLALKLISESNAEVGRNQSKIWDSPRVPLRPQQMPPIACPTFYVKTKLAL